MAGNGRELPIRIRQRARATRGQSVSNALAAAGARISNEHCAPNPNQALTGHLALQAEDGIESPQGSPSSPIADDVWDRSQQLPVPFFVASPPLTPEAATLTLWNPLRLSLGLLSHCGCGGLADAADPRSMGVIPTAP